MERLALAAVGLLGKADGFLGNPKVRIPPPRFLKDVEDALKTVRGNDTAVTAFSADKSRAPLGGKFLPIVTRGTGKVSLGERYNAVAGKAASAGLVKGDETNVQQYVTTRALDGLSTMIGEHEKKIRADPIGTGSAILKKVFVK